MDNPAPTDKTLADDRLRVTEIFYSLQGESRSIGWPTVFVRLTGCPLRCHYCDTSYAFQGGHWMARAEIVAQVGSFEPRFVTVTGGEPLAQPNCLGLLQVLCDTGYEVSLETSGALDIDLVDSRVVVVMDLKTPGSGEMERNRLENLQHLKETDQIKFVICHRADYEWARERMKEFDLAHRCEVLFSPSHGEQDATMLADWVLQDRLTVRVQLQLHKILWGEARGH
ncbi:MAG: 7-carboxy-7-deazaguanine synthase QueE [Gammaproteobacteria bacterium]|nr:MAG: 7-carboxy-7-deazaguanine synthase QueE [Gammaproteobacteria bacterium]